jgi:Ring finger domain
MSKYLGIFVIVAAEEEQPPPPETLTSEPSSQPSTVASRNDFFGSSYSRSRRRQQPLRGNFQESSYPPRYHAVLSFLTLSIDFLLYPILKSIYHILGYILFFDLIFNRAYPQTPLILSQSFSLVKFLTLLILPPHNKPMSASIHDPDSSSPTTQSNLAAITNSNTYLLDCLIYWDFFIYGVLFAVSFYSAFKLLLGPFIDDYYFSHTGGPHLAPREAPGLTPLQIQKLPLVIYKKPLLSRLFSSKYFGSSIKFLRACGYPPPDNCAICFEPYHHLDFQRHFPCLHVFHRDCVDPWLRRCSFCPLCKRILKPLPS